ncbi:MAG: hypothetical protein RRX93_07795 [Bacteroidales bacterium]
MSYNKIGYYQRVAVIKEITAAHYAPYHDQCYKMIWKKYIHSQFGICYQTYLNYLKEEPLDRGIDSKQI